MSRQFIAIATAVSLLSLPAYGADIFGSGTDDNSFLKDSYSDDWDMSDNGDPLDFEFGLRYFYSLGSSKLTVDGANYSSEDQSHVIELHGRIDDNSTDTFLKGRIGYAAAISGTYTRDGVAGTPDINVGSLGYIAADFGYTPVGTDEVRVGAYIGYEYLADNVDKTRATHINATEDDLYIHALKLGGVARAEINDIIDINLEAAAIPFAYLDGVLAGNLYGASGGLMFGVNVSDDLTIRVGGRAMYLTGSSATVPTSAAVSVTDIELMRYGALLEITGRF